MIKKTIAHGTSDFKKVILPVNAGKPFELMTITEFGPLAPPGDMHFSPQILFVLSGELEMYIQSTKVVCKSGMFCLTGPWEPHRAVLISSKVRYIVISLDLALIGSVSPFHDINWLHPFMQSPGLRPQFCTRPERAEALRSARRMLQAEKNSVPGYSSYQWLEIHRFIWYILRKTPDSVWHSSSALKKIYPAIVLARSEVHRAISIAEAARVCNLSNSRFSFLFKQETGTSFYDFSLRGRIHATTIALTVSNRGSLKQLAADYGFSDISHFYRAFRKIIGCTPLEFLSEKKNIPAKWRLDFST